jgi:MFS transporter, PAT family, beta-lactamase induction signal transducer AmpG
MRATLSGWWRAAAVYRHPRVAAMLFLGFSAGLPFLLVFSTLSAWLRDQGVERSTIGFFGWVGIMFSIKVLWAPIVDRLPLPFLTRSLGKRRSWMLVAQIGIACGVVAMAATDPVAELPRLAMLAVFVAFASATQDVAIDAWRVEAVEIERQGAMAASYIFGYRLALLVAGAGAFYIADFSTWAMAYRIMAALMIVGIITTLLVAEPEHRVSEATREMEQRMADAIARFAHLPGPMQRAAAWFSSAVAAPFLEFFRRNGSAALVILALVGLYKVSDLIMGIMANPFYIDLGFSKSEIATVAKVFGFAMTITGTAVGGILVARVGLMRSLLTGAVMVATTNLLFMVLARIGPDLWMLAVTISADNLSVGVSSVALIAYLSSLTNRAYTATQYALFSSLMTLPGQFIGGFSGVVVDAIGYANFFIYAASAGVPAILLVLYLMRHPSLGAEAAKP